MEPLDYVQAFWEGGAAAFNRIDPWSDIDLYILVDDNKTGQAFLDVEKALKTLSSIKQKYDLPQTGWPGVSQAFYKLQSTSEYLIIDLAILKQESPEKFLQPEIHGNNIFYFNKGNKIRPPSPLDNDAFKKKMHARLERLQARFTMFNNFVQKEINRGNTLEAIDAYHVITLASLVEALRIKHNPIHYDFKMHYVQYELPQKVTKELEHLYFIKNKKDLQGKYRQATKWFQKITSDSNRQQNIA